MTLCFNKARKFVLLCSLLAGCLSFGQSLPPIAVNNNHSPSGVFRAGVLTVALDIQKGEWRPEADSGIQLAVYAFGESGRPLQNPGPLIRVPQRTEIRASLHYKLPVPIAVHGMGDPGSDTVAHLAPGVTEEIHFKASTPYFSFIGAPRTAMISSCVMALTRNSLAPWWWTHRGNERTTRSS